MNDFGLNKYTLEEWDELETARTKLARTLNGKGKQTKHNRKALRAAKRAY